MCKINLSPSLNNVINTVHDMHKIKYTMNAHIPTFIVYRILLILEALGHEYMHFRLVIKSIYICNAIYFKEQNNKNVI